MVAPIGEAMPAVLAVGEAPAATGDLGGRITTLLNKSSESLHHLIEDLVHFAQEDDPDINIQQLKRKLTLDESADPTRAQYVLQKCLQQKASISKREMPEDEQKNIEKFFNRLEGLQSRICVLEEQKKVLEGIRGAFSQVVVKARPDFQRFLQDKKLLDATSEEGYITYAESLPLIQELLDTDDEKSANEVRERLNREHPGVIEKAICFGYQNNNLNSFLHNKKLKTRAENFFYSLSHLPTSPSLDEVTHFEQRLRESGLQALMDLTKKIEDEEKWFNDNKAGVAGTIQNSVMAAIQLKEYLPQGYQRISETRMKNIEDAIAIAKHPASLPERDRRQPVVESPKQKKNRESVLDHLQRLKSTTEELKTKVDLLESAQKRYREIEKIDAQLEKLSAGRRERDLELQGQIAVFLKDPYVASSLESVDQSLAIARHMTQSSYAKQVIPLLEKVRSVMDKEPPLDKFSIKNLSTPELLHRVDKYAEMAGTDLETIVGKERSLLTPRQPAGTEVTEAPSSHIPELSPSERIQFDRLYGALDRSTTLWTHTEKLANIFRSSLPGDVSFVHEEYSDIAHGKMKNSPSVLHKQVYGKVRHADIVVAAGGKTRYFGLFLGDVGAVTEPVDALFSFEGMRYRPDLTNLLSEDARKGLIAKWVPEGASQETQQAIVREKLLDKYAESLHAIASGEKSPKKGKVREKAYEDIRNTTSNAVKKYLGYFAYFITVGWIVKLVSWIFHKRFGYASTAFKDPIPAPTSTVGRKARVMFCSEFVAAVVTKAQHSLEEYVRTAAGITDETKPVMAPIISKDRPLSWWFPKQLRRLMKRNKCESVGQSPANYLLFGPRKRFRKDMREATSPPGAA